MQMEDNKTQTDESIHNSLCKLSAFDKGLKTIRVQLKLAVAEKAELDNHIEKEKGKLKKFREYPGVYNDGERKAVVD